jgi:hypothetical protein
MLNASLIVLQPIPPLCDYKVWIDTERGVEAIRYLRIMVRLNMMEEKFRARRMASIVTCTISSILPCFHVRGFIKL